MAERHGCVGGVGVHVADSRRPPAAPLIALLSLLSNREKRLGVHACFAAKRRYKSDQELAISLLIFTYV